MAHSRGQQANVRRWQWWALAGGALLGAVLIYLAAIGKWPVATIESARLLALVFVFAVNAAAVGLFAGLFVEIRHTEAGTTRSVRRWIGIALAGGFIVAVAWFDLRIPSLPLGDPGPWQVAAVLGLFAGIGLSMPGLHRFHHSRSGTGELSTRERLELGLLAGIGGLVAGMASMAIFVATSAVVHHSGETEFDQAIPLVSNVSGTYVALGDSYSAGEGLRPFNHNTRGLAADGPESNRCHRSQRAYSQLLEFKGAEPSERFIACSGAVIDDIYRNVVRREDEGDLSADIVEVEGEDVERVRVPPQVTPGRTYEDVGLVTVSIGGNDMLFSRTLSFCLEQARCMDQPFVTDLSGPRFVDYPEEQPLRDWLAATMVEVGKSFEELFEDLAESFPNARVVALGYPYLFPDRPAGLLPDECTAVLRRVSRNERLEIRAITDQFNDLIGDKAREAGHEFVSPIEIWDEHEPCGADGQYTNSINPLVGEGSFHPNEAGQSALAHLVATHLQENP